MKKIMLRHFFGFICFVFMKNFRFHIKALHVFYVFFLNNIFLYLRKNIFLVKYLQFYTSTKKSSNFDQKWVNASQLFFFFIYLNPCHSCYRDHLVLIPGGFYYWRDARSTMVHHCQRANFKDPSIFFIGPNRNELGQPYETFCTLIRHPNTPLGRKTPTTPTQEPPENRFSFRKYDENAWKCALSTFPRIKIS